VLHGLARAARKAFLAGAFTLYFGGFFGAAEAAFFRDLDQAELPFRALTWCGQVEARHLGLLVGYLGTLGLGWAALVLLGRIFDTARCDDGNDPSGAFAPAFPGRGKENLMAALMALPLWPTFISLVAGFALLGLFLVIILVIGLAQVGRKGLFQYLLIRFAVRDGMGDAGRRSG
jgi:hypothetical protein